MSLQQYSDDFKTGCWAEVDKNDCLCRGHGWALSDVDTWHECPIHFNGQRHPEDDYYDCCECCEEYVCSGCQEEARKIVNEVLPICDCCSEYVCSQCTKEAGKRVIFVNRVLMN